MIRCIRQTEFVVNTRVTAPISIIDTFVSYVVIEKKYYLICFPRDLSHFYSLATVPNKVIAVGGQSVTRVTHIM